MYQHKIHTKWTMKLLKEIDLSRMVKEMAWEGFVMIYDGSSDHFAPISLSMGVHIILLASIGRTSPMGCPSPWHVDVFTCYILWYVVEVAPRVIYGPRWPLLCTTWLYLIVMMYYVLLRRPWETVHPPLLMIHVKIKNVISTVGWMLVKMWTHSWSI